MIKVTPVSNPPGFLIELDAGVNAIFNTITLRRDGQKVRQQPSPGGRFATVYDYEAAHNTDVTYQVDGEIAVTETYDPLLVQDWATVSPFTIFGDASADVDSGKVTVTRV